MNFLLIKLIIMFYENIAICLLISIDLTFKVKRFISDELKIDFYISIAQFSYTMK